MQGNNSSNWPKFNARPVLSEAIGNAILHQRPKKLKKETKKKKERNEKTWKTNESMYAYGFNSEQIGSVIILSCII